MPIYKKSAITAKEGINYVRTITENSGSLFIKIEQENDLGIDALIEFMRDETPTHRQIAVQIKSGDSYYSQKNNECLIPVGHHREYWTKHPLPVIGVVYIPSLGVAHWTNISMMLASEPTATTLRFKACDATKFDHKYFSKIFLPHAMGTVPELSFEEGGLNLQAQHVT